MNEIEKIENAVIGCLMLDKTALGRITIEPKHIYNPEAREVFGAILELAEEDKPIDIISVNHATKFKYALKIAEITSSVSSSAHLEFHCALLIEKYTQRELITICQVAQSKLVVENYDVYEIIRQLTESVESLSIKHKKELTNLKDLSKEAIKKLDAIQQSGKSLVGIDTGFRDMNLISHGLHAPDLVIIAARPATGKTAFALNLAVNIVKQNIGVAFFSLEMSSQQLVNRIISQMTGIYQNYITKAEINDSGWSILHQTDFNLPMYIDDTPSLNILDFKEKSRKAVKQFGVKAIFVDYLQLMTVYGKNSREQEISTISRSLKALAKELNVPVIALAQLSRDVEKRNGEPRLSDLRESGAIEQDADIVIALHNETPDEPDMPKIMVKYLKHRNGEVGHIYLNFNKSKSKFENA